jgi:hypothetical protein
MTFSQILRGLGLPEPVTEHRFHPERRWRFDFAWPDLMVAVEVEGGVWVGGRHTRGKGFLADMEKYNHAAEAGWCVLRCTPTTLLSGPFLDLLTRALRRRIEARDCAAPSLKT